MIRNIIDVMKINYTNFFIAFCAIRSKTFELERCDWRFESDYIATFQNFW